MSQNRSGIYTGYPQPGAIVRAPRQAEFMLFWNYVTDFGDTAITLPLSVLMICFLFFLGERRAGIGLALALAACGIAIALVKLVLQSCGHPLLSIDLVNPSGHAALSTMVFGSLGFLLSHGSTAERRWIFTTSSLTIILAIAVSRLALAFHSPAEVLAGVALGLVALIIFCYAARSLPARREFLWLGLFALVVIGLIHGSRWPIEEVIQSLVHLIRHSVPACS
jgi:membrane-associated phospholipid phosphatase